MGGHKCGGLVGGGKGVDRRVSVGGVGGEWIRLRLSFAKSRVTHTPSCWK